MFICMYVYMYVCMHVCTKSFLKTTTNSSCVCTHLANKADSDSDLILIYMYIYIRAVYWQESGDTIRITIQGLRYDILRYCKQGNILGYFLF